jgi:hypothetical protein
MFNVRPANAHTRTRTCTQCPGTITLRGCKTLALQHRLWLARPCRHMSQFQPMPAGLLQNSSMSLVELPRGGSQEQDHVDYTLFLCLSVCLSEPSVCIIPQISLNHASGWVRAGWRDGGREECIHAYVCPHFCFLFSCMSVLVRQP